MRKIAILMTTAFILSLGVSISGQAQAAKACPDVWAPVCAKKPDGWNWTYSNKCFAKMQKAKILHSGICWFEAH